MKVHVTKIDDFRSGVIYCQLFELIFPHTVPLSRVNWKAKHDYEFIANMKMIQAALDKVKIDKRIDIEKLAKGRVQENMDFIHWLRK